MDQGLGIGIQSLVLESLRVESGWLAGSQNALSHDSWVESILDRRVGVWYEGS
jgi:hypothetical protein